MKKIGIIGGTFDPIHIAHLILAESARENLGLDKVYFVPAYISPFKQNNKPTFSPTQRLEMVKLAIEDNPYFSLLDIEITKQKVSYTYETIEYIKYELHPNDSLFFIIGMDNLKDFHKWKNPQRILELSMLAVGRRPVEINIQKVLENLQKHNINISRIVFFESPNIEISSEKIRQLLASKRSIRYLVPEKVYKYIVENMKIYEEV